MESTHLGGLLTISLENIQETIGIVENFAKQFPIDAVLGVDEQSVLVAAHLAEFFSWQSRGMPHNTIASVSAARNKLTMRERLSATSVTQPQYLVFPIDTDPTRVTHEILFPCVIKPLTLAASRGVIRANEREEFIVAFHRVANIVATSESMKHGDPARQILVEEYIPGQEVALEGILSEGKLRVLAIFDKPDPLEGPYFEETIYVTPSRLAPRVQEIIADCAQRACEALGLYCGPVHVEVRINERGAFLIEIAARSIGGYCSRALRFQPDFGLAGENSSEEISLEGLILRNALGIETASFRREAQASGVMMIPIPRVGILREVRGLTEARSVRNIESITMSMPVGATLVPLPEGGKYLGFIFSRAESPQDVEFALREAHRMLRFDVDGAN